MVNLKWVPQPSYFCGAFALAGAHCVLWLLYTAACACARDQARVVVSSGVMTRVAGVCGLVRMGMRYCLPGRTHGDPVLSACYGRTHGVTHGEIHDKRLPSGNACDPHSHSVGGSASTLIHSLQQVFM